MLKNRLTFNDVFHIGMYVLTPIHWLYRYMLTSNIKKKLDTHSILILEIIRNTHVIIPN